MSLIKTQTKINWLIVIFCLNFLFPKAGIKWQDIPLTAGYLAFAFFFLYRLLFSPMTITQLQYRLFQAWVPFQLFSLFYFFLSPPLDFGFFLSFLVHFFFFPAAFFLVLFNVFGTISEKQLISLIRYSLFFLSFYGIALFFYKLYFGVFFEIPGLTVNFSDSGHLESEKFIDRGGIYKLISTYGNGNLYGICQIFFYPLFLNFEHRLISRWGVRIALILTLSRTVWIGMILVELYLLFKNKKWKQTFPFLVVLGCISLCNYFLKALKSKDQFLFDPHLGGRLDQLDVLQNLTWFGNGGFSSLDEMVYLSILNHFGIFGLILFLLALTSPLFLLNSKKSPSALLKAGLFFYGVMALSDGAILLTPVLFLYFFSCCLAFHLLPANRPIMNRVSSG